MRLARAVKILIAAFVISLIGGPNVVAEGDYLLNYPFLQQRTQPKPAPNARRKPMERRPVVRYEQPAPRRVAPPTVVVGDAPAVPKVDPTTYIVVMGDALGDLLGSGLEEAFAQEPEIAVVRKTQGDSGLVRNDFYDWQKAASELTSGKEKITFAVMMLGANDRQSIRDDKGAYEPGSEHWRELYEQRIEAVARIFAEKRIPLFWVGLPPMQSQRYSAGVLAQNEMYRTQVQKAGGTYVDIWEAFVDDQNRFSPIGPDLNGQITRLRTYDGVYFSKAGARKAAHFVEVELKRLMDNNSPSTVIALPPETSKAPNDGQDGIDRLIDRSVAGLPEPQGLPVIPVKPIAGPIIPLTRPDLAAGGVLTAGGGNRQAGNQDEASFLIERVFGQGRPTETKPGRVDDFRWNGK